MGCVQVTTLSVWIEHRRYKYIISQKETCKLKNQYNMLAITAKDLYDNNIHVSLYPFFTAKHWALSIIKILSGNNCHRESEKRVGARAQQNLQGRAMICIL